MHRYTGWVTGLACSLLTTVSWGQSPTRTVPDSLLRYLRSARHDTTYVRAANEYSRWLINCIDDLNQADSVLTRTEALANQLNDRPGLARVYFNRGRYWMRRSELDLDPAIRSFEQARRYIERHHLPPGELQRALSGLGQAYYFKDQYETSLQHYLAAIRLTERYKLTEYITMAYSGVGDVMVVMKRFREAESYYHKAYKVAYLDRDQSMRFGAESGKASLCMFQHKYEEALQHFQKALAYSSVYATKPAKVGLLTNMANYYQQLNQLDKALPLLSKAEQITQDYSVSYGAKCMIYMGLGRYYQLVRDFPRAEIQFTKAWHMANQHHWPLESTDACEALAALYAKSHQYEKAYRYQLQLAQLTDSLFSNRVALKLRDQATRHETEQREARIRLLDQQRQSAQFERNAYLAGGLLLLLLGAVLAAWLLNRARLQRLREAHSLRQQIAHDLHDEVGSTLSSISMLSGHTQSLLSRQLVGARADQADEHATETAQRMVQRIYTDARHILESMDEIIWMINPGNDSFQRIILRLQEYAQPLLESAGIRFQFENTILLPELFVPMEVRRNVYLIGKEAINNLVKYSAATEATVRFEHQNSCLYVLITDNGRGFDPTESSRRTGQVSMRQRAEAIGGLLQIESIPHVGTTLRLSVPIG